MRRKTALLLLIILAAGMICGTGTAADAADFGEAEDTAMRLPDGILTEERMIRITSPESISGRPTATSSAT